MASPSVVRMRLANALVCVALSLLLLPSRAAAAGGWTVAGGDVRVTCPLTVGGSFQARTSALTGTVQSSPAAPPSHRADLAVNLRMLDTGIGLRTEHMLANYLEVDKAPGYDRAVLSEVDLVGLRAEAPEGKAVFKAVLALHGVQRPVSGQAELRRDGTGYRVKASFAVQLSDYQIPEPRYLGVGVKNQVTVDVTFTASPDASTSTVR